MLVIADKPGQLGNRLLVAASAYAFSLRSGVTVFNPALDEYADYFELFRRNLFCRIPPRSSVIPPTRLLRRTAYVLTLRLASILYHVKRQTSLWEVIRLDWGQSLNLQHEGLDRFKSRLVLAQGWLIRDALGDPAIRRRISEIFELRTEWKWELEAIVENLREDADLLVGVHIRQGDYNVNLNRRFFLETEDYLALAHKIDALFAPRRVKFVVSSNVDQNLSDFGPLNVSGACGHEAKDLYLLAECDYLIGPPSSYNFWASYIGAVPLWTILRPDATPALEKFVVFPAVLDSGINDLYMGDSRLSGQ